MLRTSSKTDKEILGQLYPRNIVYAGVTHTEPKYNGTRIFEINNKYYKYEDGLLVNKNFKVQKLYPTIHLRHKDFAPENQTLDIIQLVLSTFEALDRRLGGNYDDVLLHVSQNQRIARELQSVSEKVLGNPDSSVEYDLAVPLSKFAETLNESFLFVLANVRGIVAKWMLSILIALTFAWTTFFTIRLIFRLFGYCRRNTQEDGRVSTRWQYRVVPRRIRERFQRNQSFLRQPEKIELAESPIEIAESSNPKQSPESKPDKQDNKSVLSDIEAKIKSEPIDISVSESLPFPTESESLCAISASDADDIDELPEITAMVKPRRRSHKIVVHSDESQ